MSKRKNRKNSKAEAQHIHAAVRFRQRHGITLTKELKQELISKIHSGQATTVQQQSERVSVYDIHHMNRVFRIVFDRKRQTIVTVLPEDQEIKFNKPDGEKPPKAERRMARLDRIFDKLKEEKQSG